MFTAITQPRYLRQWGREHLWSAGEGAHSVLLAGAVLGPQIIRVRLLRGMQLDETRYALADGGPGTLPYHSWLVSTGDEQWPVFGKQADERDLLETYLQGFACSETGLRLVRALGSKERIYGLGESMGAMNRRGENCPVWNCDPHTRDTDSVKTMYTSIPFYIGLHAGTGRAYGLLVDHSGFVEMDMGHTSEQEAQITVEGDNLVVYFFTGPTADAVLREYSKLTGYMPLPPRWTLGYHQARWSYQTQQEVEAVVTRLRERQHPCDAVWLDIDYMRGFRCFTWDPDAFPDPATMIARLHEQHVHVVTILDPGIKIDDDYSVYQQGLERDYVCRYPDGELFTGTVWPGPCVFPDFSRAEVRDWWGGLYRDLLDQGVDGVWNDMNEPATRSLAPVERPKRYGNTMDDDVLHRAGGEQPAGPDGPAVSHSLFHNAYGMQMARASHDGIARLRPGARPFVLTRSGTAGMQRYAALWTGDNTSLWEHIPLAIRMCLNLGMSGVPFVGPDIGGFWNSSNGELLVRFAQMGVLAPFCRNHTAKGSADQEPWAFGEPYESAFRTAIETRYRLLPYLYTLFQQAAVTGAPIMRALCYHYPNDERACDEETAFLLGENLLSAPIYEPGATARSVYLPPGTWLDYWDGTEYPGGTTCEIPAPLDRWPLLVRENSILPSGPLMQYVDQQPTNPLTFTCYMVSDGSATCTLYEDDGTTLAYRDGAFAHTTINCSVSRDLVTIEIEEQHTRYQPPRTAYEVSIWVGGRVLRERIPAGQGTTKVRIVL
ncbi:MAG: glycoside hydrolase family 31 protein [Ktedonobacteraceae bacterium]|nr:glycoside hydrolase family 31 protein [Ktedonobacteraceae bacterium]